MPTVVSMPAAKHQTKGAPRAALGAHDMVRVAAEALVCVDTVRRWARGEKMRQTTALRVQRVAEKLGFLEAAR